MANWMIRPIFLTSFFSMYRNGSKPLTSPAMRQENAAASNCVIKAIPLCDVFRASQDSSVPTASGVTRPTPVTTTLRDKYLLPVRRRRLLFGLAFDVFDGVFDRSNLLRVFVGNLELEGFFESHYQFHDVQRIGAQVVHERGVVIDLAFIDA